jgi:hypothetical protein
MTGHRLYSGRRLALLFEPRDLWVGLYIAPAVYYLCLLPTLVLVWERGKP